MKIFGSIDPLEVLLTRERPIRELLNAEGLGDLADVYDRYKEFYEDATRVAGQYLAAEEPAFSEVLRFELTAADEDWLTDTFNDQGSES